ncbi:hypothetical protein EDD11_005528 [Mortierella claussenii]|nr:hypothetical protein EDD11_005528 [Mortierella claussenii]
MAIFDPAPEHLPKSARTSIDHDGFSHRMTASRPPSLESINSSNSVPFAPLPPPPPSAWKQFTNRFSQRVVRRHIKFIVALYISCAMALIPSVAHVLGNVPYLANVAVVFMHPARTIGSQLEVTFFSLVGAVLAAMWILPCQLAVAAFNQRYLPGGNNSAWAIDAAWFFIGMWIMTTYKAKYAKLNCTFIIYTIAGIFAFTRNHTSMRFNFRDFWDLMGPMILGIAICLAVSILLWPETASEGLGRALNESLDTSRALLDLSTRSFLLNHKTIALPKSVIEKAQSEVRMAQKKLYSAYREARYEVTYSMTNPADYKEVRLIVSALMRHLGSMSLVVQNERLLMLGHPDRDDEDLMTQSGAESNHYNDDSGSESDHESDTESDSEHHSDTHQNDSSSNYTGSGDKIPQQGDYFGNATTEETMRRGSPSQEDRRRKKSSSNLVESPTSEDGHSTPRKRVQRRGSAAELRRIRQLLQRAENTTQAAIRARQQHQERMQKDALHQTFQFDQGGSATAPPTPGGRGTFSVFGHHQSHRSRGSPSKPREGYHPSMEPLRRFTSNTSTGTPSSSRPSSFNEEQNLDTVKSFKSLFSVKSASKFKPDRPASLKAGFQLDNGKKRKGSPRETNSVLPIPSPDDTEDAHYATLPVGIGRPSDEGLPSHHHYHHSHHHVRGGLMFRTSLTDHQVRKAAEAFRKQREKGVRRERKLAEKEAKAEQQRIESQRQAEIAARAVPPKEVAFGDRKLFMSFLDIVRDPLQRLSDSCSRVMVAMDRELVSGLNVEQDRLERIKRRNAQRAAAVRAAEARMAGEEKAAANGATITANAAGTTAVDADTISKGQASSGKGAVLGRLKAIVGMSPRQQMSKEDRDYVEALKSGMEKEGKKKAKLAKSSPAGDTVHPNKMLQQNVQRNATFSGVEDDDEFILPPDMSYVQYLTQELEIFDKAEAEGLRDFIATHPTLDVGPREELFLIFFFLFALREIARELLRLGKYMEELEEQERRRMEEGDCSKPRKKLWWPKVFGNFWHWFAWGNYTQVKTSEGYNAVILNTTKNLEHRQPLTIEEEKALAEAKAAKAAAEKVAAEAAAKAAAEKRVQHQRRRHSEMWDLPPLRRSVTLSTLIHRKGQSPDLEQGLGGEHQPAAHLYKQRRLYGLSQEPRSRSTSPTRASAAWSGAGEAVRHHRSQRHSQDDANHVRSVSAERRAPREVDLGDPSVLGGKEVLEHEFGEEEAGSSSAHATSSRAHQYTVVEIPEFSSLKRTNDKELTHYEDVNLVELMPRVSAIKAHSTAPPEMDIVKTLSSKKSHQPMESSSGSREVVLSAPSSTHQDRYPSFASSTSPALLGHHHASDTTAVDGNHPLARRRASGASSGNESDNDSSTQSDDSAVHRRRRDRKGKGDRSRSRSLFAAFSRRPSEDASESSSRQKQPQQQQVAAPEPPKQPRTTFVSVNKPKTLRYRFWEFLQPFKSEDLKFGFKMAVALTFIGLWSWLQWNSSALATDRGQWAMMTVMAVLSPTVGATFSVCAMRIAGTLVGTLWAMLTYLALPKDPYVICAMMIVIAFAGAFLILESAHPKLGIIMLLSYSSITFIMYEGRTSETIYQVCYKRAITVIIGIIVSVIMNSLLWPILARRELRKEIAILIGRQGVLFAELVSKFLLEDPHDQRQPQQQQQRESQASHVANWPIHTQPRRDDQDGYASDELDEKEVMAKRSGQVDEFQDSFVERAEREAWREKQRRRQRKMGVNNEGKDDESGAGENSYKANLRHQVGDLRDATDPDRLAFQHVEHQLQTKLIKISQLLELSGSEPRLKEEFPMKLYKQIVQCCQNILDRMVSMRMAAQLLSPEVRELVTGPMNYYRRDMVGALLLYFSVLSSSLASKSPLPPYLPSARMARLRVIYNVREAIAAHQAVTGEDHYTYIYYYAFSSALEEVIEELELLAILIKPLVGVTLVSAGNCYSYGMPGDQLQLGSAMVTDQLELPPINSTESQAGSSIQNPGTDAPSSSTYEQHMGMGGNFSTPSAVTSRMPSAMMINIGATDTTTAGMGAGAFGQSLQYPQDMLYQQQRLLQQQQAQQQYQQSQLQLQLQAQQQLIQQQQQQLLLQQQQLSSGLSFHPDLAVPAPSRILINPQIVPVCSPNVAGVALSPSAAAAAATTAVAVGGRSSSPVGSVSSSSSKSSHGNAGGPRVQSSALRKKGSKRKGLKVRTSSFQVDISPPTAGAVDNNHNNNNCTNLNTPQNRFGAHTHNVAATAAANMTASPILMMDESLLGNRHAQRYKEAIQVAQAASGQKMIEIPSPTVAVVPAQIQIPMGAVSSGSSNGKQRKGSASAGGAGVASPQVGVAVNMEGFNGAKRPSLVTTTSNNSISGQFSHHHPHHRLPSHQKNHQGGVTSHSSLPAAVTGATLSTNSSGSSPYSLSIPAAIVMPFGSDMIAEPPLPLHMIPMQAQQQQQQWQQQQQPLPSRSPQDKDRKE